MVTENQGLLQGGCQDVYLSEQDKVAADTWPGNAMWTSGAGDLWELWRGIHSEVSLVETQC